MKIKTSELIGPALDWAVATCEGVKTMVRYKRPEILYPNAPRWTPMPLYSTDWAQGGPIIERENMGISAPTSVIHSWTALKRKDRFTCHVASGPTALIAAMRCFVASKLGDEVEIPEELK